MLNENCNELLLWQPTHGTRRRGRPKTKDEDTLMRDTGATDAHNPASVMEDGDVWRSMVESRSHPSQLDCINNQI